MSDRKTFEFGQTVFIQLVEMMPHDERLAYLPDEKAGSFMEAYAASLYATEAEAEAAVKRDFDDEQADQMAEVADGSRDEDEVDDETMEFVREGVVNEDGSITFKEGDVMTAEQIWGRCELQVPEFAVLRSPRV